MLSWTNVQVFLDSCPATSGQISSYIWINVFVNLELLQLVYQIEEEEEGGRGWRRNRMEEEEDNGGRGGWRRRCMEEEQDG